MAKSWLGHQAIWAVLQARSPADDDVQVAFQIILKGSERFGRDPAVATHDIVQSAMRKMAMIREGVVAELGEPHLDKSFRRPAIIRYHGCDLWQKKRPVCRTK